MRFAIARPMWLIGRPGNCSFAFNGSTSPVQPSDLPPRSTLPNSLGGLMPSRKARAALAALALAVVPSVSHGQLLGKTLGLQYLYPDMSTVFSDAGTAVVGATVEWPGFLGFFDIDVSASSILINITSGTNISSA